MTRAHKLAAARWAPRILAIMFTLFIAIFALDVFEEEDWLIALIIHLIPNYILIVLTIIAWKNEFIGGTAFILAALLTAAGTRLEAAILYIPSICLGALFLASWYMHRSNNQKEVRV